MAEEQKHKSDTLWSHVLHKVGLTKKVRNFSRLNYLENVLKKSFGRTKLPKLG